MALREGAPHEGNHALQEGDQLSLEVTPDRYVTIRYAGASGDFNPIHIDEEFARQVGLPGRILHGLWSMAQVARTVTEATGDPAALKSLSVQFRGMGRIGEEVTVTGTVKSVAGDLATVKLEARQDDARLVRNGIAEVAVESRTGDD